MKIFWMNCMLALFLAALCGCETTSEDPARERTPGSDVTTLDDGNEGVQTRAYEEDEESEVIGVGQKF